MSPRPAHATLLHRIPALAAAAALTASLLTGCASLADERLISIGESDGDRMVGFFITLESDEDPFFELADEDGRIYAEEIGADAASDTGDADSANADDATDTGDADDSDGSATRFPVDGYACYLETTTQSNGNGGTYQQADINCADGIECSLSQHVQAVGDFENVDGSEDDASATSNEITATMTIAASDFWAGHESPVLILNPVYRTPDGRYYMTSGDGYLDAGYDTGEDDNVSVQTTTLSESWTPAKLGKEITSRYSFTLKHGIAADSVRVLQFSADDTLLKTDTLTPGSLPENYTTESGAAWLLIETVNANSEVTQRTIVEMTSTDAESPDTFTVYNESADGVLVPTDVSVTWTR